MERNDPGAPNAIPPPLGGTDGGLEVGSGKLVTPWARMHSASLSSSCLRASDPRPPRGPPPGRSLKHTRWAAWNAGDAGLTPEPAWIWMPPPPEPGSGKFGTPCARMHSENLRPESCLLLAFELPEPPEPQAARSSAQASATTASPRPVLPVMGALIVTSHFLVRVQ